jgi:hypothetical protein
MNEHITHYVGNRSPSLFGTILVDGVAVNLTGSTVKLQMRLVTSSTLKVDTSAVVVSAVAGTVRYDWAAIDVDTAGAYVAWWRVTNASGLIQDTPEFYIEILAHAAAGNEYISVAELKEMLSLSGETFADGDLARATVAASRAVDGLCDTQFYLGTPGEVRKYTPVSAEYLMIDDATTITAVSSQGTALVLDTDYANFRAQPTAPISVLRALTSTILFPRNIVNGVSVTGTFGWASPPGDVKQATAILASRLFKRSREAAFGVVGFDLDGGAIRIPGRDPDVYRLLAPYMRSGMIE